MDFRASGVRSLKLNIFLILKEVKTNLILRSASQKCLSNCRRGLNIMERNCNLKNKDLPIAKNQ